ncbi:uncharacterized protein LOC121001065, partial [Bufo bufo]|uniref:uncharacterized protein LOC121001065 n=1 Tax=Bufo bufo TaxID=8384 RepID=UPI001ABED872
KKNYQYSEKDQNSSSIIKFLNTTVSKFSKKGSSQIANHLELYESTMDSLKLYSDADRIRFLPWAFDDKYRHYFTSFRERGIQDWPSVLHEVKLEFGPYRTITAAKRDIYKLTCRPNQSPREFLSILKNAYGLAYRSPNWESEEFKQLFYDAMPTQIKLSLARDLDIEAPLDRLVTAATTLYNISECHETGERRFKKSPEQNIAEAKVNPSLGFETQPRKYSQSTGPVQQTQQQQVRPKQTKPQNPNGSEGDNSGAGRSNYRPYYNNGPQYRSYYNRDSQGYRRWNNRPRQQREDRQEPLNSPRSRSPTNNQGASQNQNMRKPNRFAVQIDLVNKTLWSRLPGDPEGFQDVEQALRGGQQMPYAVSIEVAEEVEIPEGCKPFLLPIQVKKGQKLKNADALICLSNRMQQLGLKLKPTPMINVHQVPLQMVVHNMIPHSISLQKDTVIGLAMESEYYTFGFQNDVIGLIPDEYLTEEQVKGHSKYPGMDKEGNDLADSLAKQAAIDGEVFDVDDLMGTMQVDATTRRWIADKDLKERYHAMGSTRSVSRSDATTCP